MPGGKGSIISAVVWMFVISVLLFWMPVLGPALAGFVGGKKAGGVGPAIIAVFLPAIVFGAILFLMAGTLVGLPLVGIVAGVGGFALASAHVGPMLVGAVIGGAMA